MIPVATETLSTFRCDHRRCGPLSTWFYQPASFNLSCELGNISGWRCARPGWFSERKTSQPPLREGKKGNQGPVGNGGPARTERGGSGQVCAAGAGGVESSELCRIRRAGGAARTQVRLDEQLGGRGQTYLVKTVADAAELRRELAGRTDDGLEEALRDLQKVALVLLQVLTLFQPVNADTGSLESAPVRGTYRQPYRRLTWWDPPRS